LFNLLKISIFIGHDVVMLFVYGLKYLKHYLFIIVVKKIQFKVFIS